MILCFSLEWTLDEDNKFRDIEKCISMYRRIYSYNNLCNNLFGSVIIPTLKLGFASAFILCFFICVRLYKELDLPVVLLALLICPTCLIVLTAMSIVMSSLYDISAHFRPNIRAKIQKIESTLQRKILQRELDACPTLRCCVGSVYHMEAKAKLTLVHSILNGVACLLINVKV